MCAEWGMNENRGAGGGRERYIFWGITHLQVLIVEPLLVTLVSTQKLNCKIFLFAEFWCCNRLILVAKPANNLVCCLVLDLDGTTLIL